MTAPPVKKAKLNCASKLRFNTAEQAIANMAFSATKCGGPEDIVNGILIDVENQLQLEDAMMTMYKNASKYDKQKLRSDAKDRFGEKAFIKNAMKYYEVGINNGK
jgi:hypothetical protein